MAFINCGKIDKKLFLVLILEVIKLVNIIISQNADKNKTSANKTLSSIEEEIGSIVLGIILLFKFKHKKPTKKRSPKCIIYIIFLFLIKGAEECYHYIFNYNALTKYNLYKLDFTVNGFELILVTVGTHFLLKYKYYIHHIISLIIYVILGVGIDLILEKFKNDLQRIYIYIIYTFVYIGKYLYMKYMMDKLFYHHIEILIYLGIIGIIQKVCIFAGLSVYENKNNITDGRYRNIFGDISDYFHRTNVAVIIFYQILYFFIVGAFERLLVILILYYLKPNHMIMADNIYIFVSSLFNLEKKIHLCSIILFSFQIFTLLFYCEILEMNFCKLNRNTAKNILTREIEDEDSVNPRCSTLYEIELPEHYYIDNSEFGTKNDEGKDLLKSYENSKFDDIKNTLNNS